MIRSPPLKSNEYILIITFHTLKIHFKLYFIFLYHDLYQLLLFLIIYKHCYLYNIFCKHYH
ncbi:hypothetical protein UF66_1700 [Staphylococcus cohnii subsp. cohnii]|uniref:Uncharacterized protein n=1 Tax=Staphylococcus cohnii subsp. cohnii TaxID=74704 RepID=A0A0M2NYM7_STACC|nr:hypothetical protein UF66_1700 [Staphylococcus cohnii subsp. cohnii]